ncbi:hypothetical protein HLB44_02445 [Aquincola sp. S2]|uniref:Calcium-binding protein n=1 Tax=Pseudaquabacterium terrae TaxID=2732868 RepID=A0ABX2E9Y4_9BURK|nr:calcium-binding protein [Aquabacterium terrae]NRF65839.1 hypothetical protein [Aquabacterium terrae]
MSAGPELRAYGANLNQAHANVREVRAGVGEVRERLDTVEMVIDAIDSVERQADAFGRSVGQMQLALKLMDKTGPLKALATLGAFVLDKLETVARQVEAKADALARRIDDSGLEALLTSAQDKLESLDAGLLVVEETIAHDAGVIGGMVKALDTVDALDPAGDPAAPLAASIEPLVAVPNAAVGALNDAYATIKAEVLALGNAVPNAAFLPVLGVRIAFDKISASLAFLRGPLDLAGQMLKPIEPILDAAGLLFDLTVRPVIDFLLQTLGLRQVIDAAADRITALLPNAGVLDTVLDDFDAALQAIDPLAALDDALGITAWVGRLDSALLAPVGNPQAGPIGIGSGANDVLQGRAVADLLDGAAGDDTVHGDAGDDVLLAGPGQDVLDGGSGTDRVVFRGNLIEYRFSQSAQGGELVFHHLYPADPRISDGSEVTRNIETYSFADLSLTQAQLMQGVRIATPGQTLLAGSDDIDILFAAATAITIDAGGGNDVLAGSPANDQLRGGSGDDVIVRSAGNDGVDGGSGRDTWRFGIDNTSGNPHVDVDLQRGSALVGGTTTTLLSIEAVVVEDNRSAYLYGSGAAEQLTSATTRDLLDGRGGDDVLDGGAGDDVLIGGPGADVLFGGAGTDALAAGERALAGVANHYDGGDGSNDTLSYAADLREQVEREHFDTGLRGKVRFQQASGPIRLDAATGRIERLSDDGLTVIATDTAVGIERYIGSDANDALTGAAGITVSLDGGGGNDRVVGLGVGLLGGGSGDDVLVAAPGSSAAGGGGFDTLDLGAQPGVRWLVRLDGAIGSALRAFNAIDGSALAVPGGSLQNESGPSLLGAGTVADIDRYVGSAEDDHFELRSSGAIVVHAAAGDDYLHGRGGGSSTPSFQLFGEVGDDHLVLQETGLADGGEGHDRLEVDADAGDAVQVRGGAGDDTILVRGGQAVIDGGTGRDTLSAAASNVLAGLVLDLAAGTLAATGSSPRFGGTVTGIETAIGSDLHDDTLRGSAAGETLIGGGGNDLLEGRGGADALYGGAGGDTLRGDDGDDLLDGGDGADVIDGRAGADLLVLDGNDTALGGDGSDHFVIGLGTMVIDGGAGLDSARLSGARSDYPLIRDAGSGWRIADDALQGIERLQFADAGLALDLDGAAGTVARLLGAVFGPAAVANAAYAGIGLTLKDGGMSDEALAALALDAAGAHTAPAIVALLWTNLFDTPPSAAQAAPFIAWLDQGMSPGALGLLAAVQPVNEARIDLVGLVDSGLAYSEPVLN